MKRVRAEILSTRTLGAYRSLTLVAPELAERARPGQFVAVAMPEDRTFLLRRHLTIHQSSRRGGWAGTLEFVVDASAGPGTAWLGERKAHETLDVIGVFESILDKDLLKTGALKHSEIYSATPVAKELIQFVTKLKV